MRETTSVTVRLNAKLETVNLMQIPSPADGSVIQDGYCVTRDSNGKAILAASTTTVPFIVYKGNNRSDTQDSQGSPMADLDTLQSITIETGGLSVIGSAGIEIGLPISLFDPAGVASAASVVVGDGISVGAGGLLKIIAAADMDTVTISDANPKTVGLRIAGYVTRVTGQIVWFQWLGGTIPIYGTVA